MPAPDRYLYRAASDVPYFSSDGGETYLARTPLRDLEKSRPLRVLSEDDFAFWQTYGYVVVKEAVPADHARRLLDFAWDFQGLDPERPETWYSEDRTFATELEQHLHVYGFVEAYHHQLLWDSRQTRRVYDAFADVWDCEELWVTLDRLNLNPPNVKDRDRALIEPTDKGFDIELHWDVDTTLGVLPQRVQGIIALNDTQDDHGGFQCSPELFRRFEEWKVAQPADRDPIRPGADRTEFPVVRPELKAGDLLIWNGLLAHGVAANISDNGVRAVQYLSMMPALEADQEVRKSRVESWRSLSTPDWNKTLVGDARRHESLRYPTATLNELGAKLLGLESWHGQDTGGQHTERPSGDPSCAPSA
ncbi:hypothetical protein DWB77_02654 [Streptomyces hundungensis]|uniref:Phytanoyl-CoA dioxygenase n=1 Tax=Streptomyces hundungensis TaxID=1077946 RepID=A0A387HAT7_9ACTN|nr:phytanoyl-CoA dioxygenase family protein [Streptomyces hundungensis]AYG80519.1 hypothetical protein DWB77_02654 [Streptomyces hundungensis]